MTPTPPPPLPPALPQTTNPLSYASPADRPMRFAFCWSVFLWSAAVIGLWIAIIVFVVPRFRESLQDFKIEITRITRVFLSIARFAASGGWVLLATIPFALGFIAGPLSPRGRWLVRVFITLMLGGVIVFTLLAMAQPLTAIMESLTSARSRP